MAGNNNNNNNIQQYCGRIGVYGLTLYPYSHVMKHKEYQKIPKSVTTAIVVVVVIIIIIIIIILSVEITVKCKFSSDNRSSIRLLLYFPVIRHQTSDISSLLATGRSLCYVTVASRTKPNYLIVCRHSRATFGTKQPGRKINKWTVELNKLYFTSIQVTFSIYPIA